jgi:hypothetical protein
MTGANMPTRTLVNVYEQRAAHALLACTKRPNQPTLITQDEQEQNLQRWELVRLATHDCLDAVEPAQGSHEGFASSTFAHAEREA